MTALEPNSWRRSENQQLEQYQRVIIESVKKNSSEAECGECKFKKITEVEVVETCRVGGNGRH